jgi:hypothetical protein
MVIIKICLAFRRFLKLGLFKFILSSACDWLEWGKTETPVYRGYHDIYDLGWGQNTQKLCCGKERNMPF